MNFGQAVVQIRDLKVKPTNDELLEVYALYKQATVGDVTTSRPSFFYAKERAKWDRWFEKKGMNKIRSKREYVNKVKYLLDRYEH